MPTIYDIARAAGVSHMTVSRVLNGSDLVKRETRERILELARNIGYYPNELARGLVQGKTRTVALIVSDITTPFFTTVARGVEDIAVINGYSVVLCNTDEKLDKERSYLDLVLRKQFDGLLLASAAQDEKDLEQFRSANLPLVLIDRRVAGFESDLVKADGYSGAKDATKHLIERTGSVPALITGPRAIDVMKERIAGYSDALREAGHPYSESLVFEGELHFESGVVLGEKLLDSPLRPRSVLCTNSSIGLGAYTAIRNAGLIVPEELAIVVFDFDAVDIYSKAFPFITSVFQPAYEIGAQAMDLLVRRIDGEEADEPIERILPTKLVIRSST